MDLSSQGNEHLWYNLTLSLHKNRKASLSVVGTFTWWSICSMSPITANSFILKRKMIPIKLLNKCGPLNKFSFSKVSFRHNFLGLLILSAAWQGMQFVIFDANFEFSGVIVLRHALYSYSHDWYRHLYNISLIPVFCLVYSLTTKIVILLRSNCLAR